MISTIATKARYLTSIAGYSVLCRSSIVHLVRVVVVGANRGVVFQGDAQFIGYCGRSGRPASEEHDGGTNLGRSRSKIGDGQVSEVRPDGTQQSEARGRQRKTRKSQEQGAMMVVVMVRYARVLTLKTLRLPPCLPTSPHAATT